MARKKSQAMSQTLAMLNAGDPEPAPAAPAPVTVETLQAQLASLQATIAEQAKEIQTQRDATVTMMSTPDVVPAAAKFKPTDVNFDNLPDPMEDKEGYGRELARRYQTALDNKAYNERVIAEEQAASADRAGLLWEGFKENYSEYGADEQKVRIAAAEVAQLAARKRMNLDKYMYGNSNQFYKDVTKVYDKLFGKPAPQSVLDDDEGDDDDAPEVRTMGIFGGQESGGKAANGPKPTAAKPGGFTQAIREWQVKNGFYR